MKATGIVRRIDDLGRVVIPKEIRRTLRIREGDPLEIFTSNDGEVIFKKYSPIGELSAFAGQYAEILHKTSSRPVIVCDRDHVVSASGLPKKELLERRISPALEELIEERKSYIYGQQGGALLYPVEGIERPALVEYPHHLRGGCVRFDSLSGRRRAHRPHRGRGEAAAGRRGIFGQADGGIVPSCSTIPG